MAKTYEQLQAIRDKILDQLDSPESVTAPDGAGVRFRSQADLRAALADIDREINAVTGATPGRVFTIQTSRGIS
jgi:hypothetical protein